jgi:hypothetical protein
MWPLLKIRFYGFLIGCIGSRLLFTLASAYAPRFYLRLMGAVALLPVLGWISILFFHPRDTGLEVFGDEIWWKHLRPIHTLLWGFFAYLALQGNRHAWMVLAVDTLVGLGAFFHHHSVQGNLGVMFS